MGSPVFDRKRGVVKTVLRAKQYGFIQVSDKEEYFFHSTALQGMKFSDLIAGDAVSFIPTIGKGGKLRAVGIRRIDVDMDLGSSSSSVPDVEGVLPEGAGTVRDEEDPGEV